MNLRRRPSSTRIARSGPWIQRVCQASGSRPCTRQSAMSRVSRSWIDCRCSTAAAARASRACVAESKSAMSSAFMRPPGSFPQVACYQKRIGRLLYVGTVWVQVGAFRDRCLRRRAPSRQSRPPSRRRSQRGERPLGASPIRRPPDPGRASTSATSGADDVHTASAVTSSPLRSLKTRRAWRLTTPPTMRTGSAGVKETKAPWLRRRRFDRSSGGGVATGNLLFVTRAIRTQDATSDSTHHALGLRESAPAGSFTATPKVHRCRQAMPVTRFGVSRCACSDRFASGSGLG